MNNLIENRVVKATFDNSRFNKNIKASCDAIDTFNEKLAFKRSNKGFSDVEKNVQTFSKNVDSQMNNASKSIRGLSSSIESVKFDPIYKNAENSIKNTNTELQNVDFSPMTSGIESVKMKFSALQVAGATAISNITSNIMTSFTSLKDQTIGQISSGGKNRALNIEAAKFKISNLMADNTKGKNAAEQAKIDAKNAKKAAETWTKAYSDMDYAVKGTAYGIDAAASAASQLMASNVKLGDQMKYSLRAISGIAAMTGSTYEDISSIFTSAAGKGKVQTDELTRIAYRGLNATAVLAKALHTTEETVSDMASSGKLDFKTFAKAMDDAFGESATKANSTYTGALANMKAALSRIGEPIYTSLHENLKDSINKTTKIIDKFKNALAPKKNDKIIKESFIGAITNTMTSLKKRYVETANAILKSKKIEDTLSNLGKIMYSSTSGFLESVDNIKQSLKSLFTVVKNIITPIKDAYSEIFPGNDKLKLISGLTAKIKTVTAAFSEFIEKVLYDKDSAGNNISNKLYQPFLLLFRVLKAGLGIIKGIISGLVYGFKIILKISAPAVKMLADMVSALAAKISYLAFAFKENQKVKIFVDFIKRAIASLKTSLESISYTTSPITDGLKSFSESVKKFFTPAVQWIKEHVNGVINPAFEKMNSAFRTASDTASKTTDKIEKAKDAVKNDDKKDKKKESFFENVWKKIQEIKEKLKQAFTNNTGIGELFRKLYSTMATTAKTIFNAIKNALQNGINGVIDLLVDTFIHLYERLGDALKNVKFWDVIGKKWKLGLVRGLGKSITKVISVFTNLDSIILNFAKIVNNEAVHDSMVKRMELIKEIIHALALCVLSIAFSIAIISSIDPKSLERSVTAIMSMFLPIIAVTMVVASQLQKVSGNALARQTADITKKGLTFNRTTNIFTSLALFIQTMGSAMLELSIAMKLISTIKDDKNPSLLDQTAQVIVGMLTMLMGSIFAIMFVTNKLAANEKQFIAMTGSFSLISKMISKIGSAIKQLGIIMFLIGKTLDPQQYKIGMNALTGIGIIIAGLMFVIYKFASYMGKRKEEEILISLMSLTNFLSVITRSIVELAIVLFALGKNMNWEEFKIGIVAIGSLAGMILLLMLSTKLFLPKKNSDKDFEQQMLVIINISKFLKLLSRSVVFMATAMVTIMKITKNWDQFRIGIIAISTISALLFGLMVSTKLIDESEAKNFMILAGAMLVISAAITVLSKALIPFVNSTVKWDDLYKIGAIIGGVIATMLAIGMISKIKGIENAVKIFAASMLALGAALALLGIAVKLFIENISAMEGLKFNPKHLVDFCDKLFAVIPTILGRFVGYLATALVTFVQNVFEVAASNIDSFSKSLGKFLNAFMSAVASVTSNFNMEELLQILGSVAIIFAIFWLLSKMVKKTPKALAGLAAMSLIFAVMGAVFSMMVSSLGGANGKDVVGLASGFALSVAAIAGAAFAMMALGKIGGTGAAETMLAGAKAFFIGAGIMLAVVAVIGLIGAALNMTGMKDNAINSIKSGFDILNLIAEELGKLIGSFVGGLAEGVLPKIGTALSDFMTNLKGFLDGAKSIKVSEMEGLLKMAKAIAVLLAGTILYGVSKAVNNPLGWITGLSSFFGNSPLKKMGKELSDFAPYMKKFANTISGIKDPSKLETICKAVGECIGALEKNLPYNVDAFWGLFSVKKTSLSDFGKQMKEFAPTFVEFANEMTKAKAGNDLVTKCKNIGLMIKNLQENLPWKVKAFWDFWGLKGSVDVHQTPLNEYGKQMSAFSETFVEFANNISGVDNDAFTKAERIASMIATISGSMGTETTVATWLGVFDQHKQSLTNFAYDLNNASKDFKTFITTMGGIKTDDVDLSSVDTIVSIITKFSNFQKDNAEWKPGPLIEFFAGKKETLSDFASNLALAVPKFRSIGTSIAKDEWATIKDSQLTSVKTTMSAIKSFIEALPDDDMKKKIEKWSKIGVNDINLQNLADVMFGWDKAVYNFDGTRATEWHGNEWVDANKRIPGFIDIISETSKKINGIAEITDVTKFTDISTAVNKIFDIIKIFTDKDSKIDLNDSDTKTKIGHFSEWVKAAGDGLIEAVSMIKGSNQFSQNGKIDKTDFNVFSQVVDAITKVFESWDKFATTTNTNGNLGTAINSALAAISKVVSKFKDFSSDVDKDKAQKVLDWFDVFLKGFGDFDDKKIAKIDKVNTAFANLAGSAFNIAERTKLGTDQTGDGGVAYQINKLSTHYNNIILKALDKSQNELKTGYLNSKQIVTEYPLLEILLNKLSGNVDNKKNAFYRKIVAVENAAYDKLYSYTHTNNGHTEDHNFEKIGKYIADGMAFGINTNMQVVRNAANQLGEEAIKAAMKRLREKSPSKEFEKIGMNTTAGYIIGMTSMTAELKKTTAKTFGDTLTTATQTATAQLTKAGKDTANKGFRTFYKNGVKMVEAWAKLEGRSYSPTIAPVVDSSKLDKKYATISTASLSLDMDSKSVKQLSSLSASFDAKNEQKIQVDNKDVVNAVNNLDKRFGQLESAIGGMEVKMDGDKTVGAIAPKMNKALGEQFRRSRRGN